VVQETPPSSADRPRVEPTDQRRPPVVSPVEYPKELPGGRLADRDDPGRGCVGIHRYRNDYGHPNVLAIRSYVSHAGQRSPTVTAEQAGHVAADDPTFPAPTTEHLAVGVAPRSSEGPSGTRVVALLDHYANGVLVRRGVDRAVEPPAPQRREAVLYLTSTPV
jgi:hypothetical protein